MCKGGNPSRTFTLVSVRRQVGSKPPFPSPTPSFSTNPSGRPPPIEELPGQLGASNEASRWWAASFQSHGGGESETSQLEPGFLETDTISSNELCSMSSNGRQLGLMRFIYISHLGRA